MKIKELSEKTGLSKKTIRFYEDEGLFEAEKTYQNGRAFHNYTEENAHHLLRIATLRRARFSIEEIRRMQESPEDTADIFKTYRLRIREDLRELQDILAVVEEIQEDKVTSADDLICQMETVAQELPLPVVDVHPHFRYLDELAEIAEIRQRKKIAMEKRRSEALEIGLYTAVSSGAAYRKNPRELAPGNEEKLAIMHMLRNDRE